MAQEATISGKIAAWAANLTFENIPPDVLGTARRALSDTLAVTLAGSHAPVTGKLLSASESDLHGVGATVIGRGLRARPETAALLNGTAAHALDFDDTCFAGIVHGSAAILPALLAAAETGPADGRALLTAFVAGSEVAYTIGAALGPALYGRGWWPTGCLAGIGAAAAVARLQRADESETAHAITLAAAQSGGLRVIHGSDAKPILMGRAAEVALRSATMARRGLAGPERVFEGTHGIFALIGAGDVDLDAINGICGIGRTFKLRDPGLVVKPYPVCSCAMQAVEALCRLMSEHEIDPEAIARIDCAVTPMVAATLRFDRPATPVEALFSLPFTLALAATRGGIGPTDITAAALADPDVHGLMDKVSYREDLGITDLAAYPEAARVDLTLADGSTFSHLCDCASGDPRAPMSDEGLQSKFMSCAEPVLGGEAAGKLYALARQAEELPDLNELMGLARGG